ncbi:endonuclease/exonuclease/phosphatase family protein [Tomitella biformata]|uniref:endonuclease/exonuclease/phosphatase family protein n=1 Tax=Tomitella biformata TaxID=630403 RepID=UPI000464AE6C|nr:endonuclease/exonuclease/phosphatase family protein [Tomitella biformata]
MAITRDNVLARRAAQAAGVAGITIGIVAVVAMYSTGPINPLIAAASFVPFLLAVTLLAALICLAFRRWILLGISVALLGVGASAISPMYVANGARAEGTTVRVMQANLLFGQADPDSLTRTVRERSIDVLTVQELTETLAASLRAAGLEQLLQYQYLIPDERGGGGAGIYSRYPLTDTRELDGYGPTNLGAEVGFSTPFTLLAVHPGPAYVTPPDIWTNELRNLRAALETAAASDTIIVSGDFNTTYLHKQFRDLLAVGYSDAAEQLGAGIVRTYPADKRYPAVIGIDHVLLRGAQAQTLERVEIEGSDHHGLIVDVVIPS